MNKKLIKSEVVIDTLVNICEGKDYARAIGEDRGCRISSAREVLVKLEEHMIIKKYKRDKAVHYKINERKCKDLIDKRREYLSNEFEEMINKLDIIRCFIGE